MQINMGSNIALIFTQYIICHTFIFILLIINGLLWLLFNFSHPQTHFTGYKVTWNNGKVHFSLKNAPKTLKNARKEAKNGPKTDPTLIKNDLFGPKLTQN